MTVKVVNETIQEFNGERFYLCGPYYQHDGRRLHRLVWESVNGEIPKGYHVHHIDGNKANNDISNLELVEAPAHISRHMHTEDRQAYGRRHVKEMQELAKEWHRSPEGREWHREHAIKAAAMLEPVEYTCMYCGKTFLSKKRYAEGSSRFCSNKCRSAYRRKIGADNVEKVCAFCGKTFMANKYSKSRTCSLSCGRRLMFEDRRNNVCREG